MLLATAVCRVRVCCSMQSLFFSCVPFLGETFSCFVNCGSRRVSYIAEQCTVHPNTTAFYVEDDQKEFQINGCMQPKVVFCGSSIRYALRGKVDIRHRCGDSFSFTLPTLLYSSLLHGTPEIQICGQCLLSSSLPCSARLEFIERVCVFRGFHVVTVGRRRAHGTCAGVREGSDRGSDPRPLGHWLRVAARLTAVVRGVSDRQSAEGK